MSNFFSPHPVDRRLHAVSGAKDATAPERRGRLIGVQAGRGVAALLVVLVHGGDMIRNLPDRGHAPLWGLFDFGHAGVDFFFVLSGFIICYVHYNDLGAPQRLTRYLWRRITRIYPIYWIVTLFLIAYGFLRHPGMTLTAGHIVASFLLIHHDQSPILVSGWTLEHEVLFYLIFAVAILNRRLGAALFAAWMALVLAGLFIPLKSETLVFLSSYFHVQFLMGIGCAYIVLTGRIRFPRMVAAAGIVGFLATGLLEDVGVLGYSSVTGHFFFGSFASLTIIGIALAELRGSLRVGRIGALLGDASYSLYLWHLYSNNWVAGVLIRLGLIAFLPGWVVLFACAAGSVTFACLFYRAVERPLIRRLQHWGNSRIVRAPQFGS
jgi:exopolysaccharide production protein ExoZ